MSRTGRAGVLFVMLSHLVIPGVAGPYSVGPPNVGPAIEGRELAHAAGSQQATPPAPVLAYYYLWFDEPSWNRAKTDFPELGRYSSDDPRVMRQHIQWAKSARIDGFIVSWKNTPVNNRRLQLLAGIAKEENFKLAMIYQGLDFDRNPLGRDRVRIDFEYFARLFAPDQVFIRMSGKPLTILSGTWKYTHDDVAAITDPVRSTLQVLSTEKSVAGYRRIADVTDGDAYYWSSVDPQSQPDYESKLNDMSEAVHGDSKLWVAPFAPGFDARQIGGARAVQRDDGRTMALQYRAATSSSPDVLGLISWNEFSENTFVEPSLHLGHRYLSIVLDLLSTPSAGGPGPAQSGDSGPDPVASDLDSSASGGDSRAFALNIGLLIGFVVTLVGGITVLARRRKQHRF